MSVSADNIVSQIVQDLEDRIKTGKPSIESDALIIIDEWITNVVSQTKPGQRNTIYKKLSQQFHPDRFNTMHPGLFNTLNKLHVAEQPQKVLKPALVTPEPTHLVIDNVTNPQKDFISLIIEPFLEQYKRIIPGTDEYKRYYQPFKTIDWIFSAIINITLLLTAVAPFIAFGLGGLTVWILGFVRKEMIWIIEGRVKKEKFIGFSAAPAIALFHALRKPLPENWFLAALAVVFVKPLIIITSLPILLFSTLLDLAKIMLFVGGTPIWLSLVSIKLTTLTLTNLPLYILDGLRYVRREIVNWFSNENPGAEAANDRGSEPQHPSSHRTESDILSALSGTSKTAQADSQHADQPHFDSVIKPADSVDITDSRTIALSTALMK